MAKRKRYLIVGLVVVLCVVVGVLAQTWLERPDKVVLSESIIDEAVVRCNNSETWSIALPDVRVDYVVGVEVEAAIVLHNGNDADRFVSLAYQAILAPKMDGSTGVAYNPPPDDASEWVTVGIESLRMDEMQTEVVRIWFLVPEDTEIESEHWEFDIVATGVAIKEIRQDLGLVATGTDDTILGVVLEQPLLEGGISGIEIWSEIEEFPYVVGYAPDTRLLTIRGLLELETREMMVTYEYADNVAVAYVQRWLITML